MDSTRQQILNLHAKPSSLRCTFCHGPLDGALPGADLEDPHEKWTCSGCGALLHSDCQAEAAGCPTLGCREAPEIRVRPRRAGRWRALAWTIGLSALVALWILVAQGQRTRYLFWGTRTFDAQAWQEPSWEAQQARGEMLFSLLTFEGVEGKTRSEIEELLGAAEIVKPDLNEDGYLLGCHSGFLAIDVDVLYLTYDGEGRVRGYRVVNT